MWWETVAGHGPAGAARAWLEARPQSVLHVVDTHTAGNPTRIIVSGLDLPPDARTVAAARDWLREHADWVRTRLDHEPRGGALTCAVLPLPAVDDSHDIGAVILEPGSYPPMCGHCMIGLATVVHELGLARGAVTDDGATRYRILAPAGLVTATVREHPGAATTVDLENVESYVVDRWTQRLAGREVPCALVYGGDYYPTLDAAALGIDLDRAHADRIVGLARELAASVEDRAVIDPITGERADIYQVMFHQRVDDPRRATTAVVAPPGVIDRSPCGTGSSALMALKVDEGAVAADEELVTTSLIGSTFRVRTNGVRTVADRPVIRPVVTGSAHINGFSTIVADPSDEFADGFAPL